jgi:hypothetical protein
VTDADQYSDVAWFPKKRRSVLRRLIAEVAWEQGDNTQSTDRTMGWVRRAYVRFTAGVIVLYPFIIGWNLFCIWLAYYFFDFQLFGVLAAFVIYIVGSLAYYPFYNRTSSQGAFDLGRAIIAAIRGAQGLVQNPSDSTARQRALLNITKISQILPRYVSWRVSGNAPRRLRIAPREICSDQVLAILRLFEPTMYATTRNECILLRDELVRVLLKVANDDLKSISLIGSSWPLPKLIVDARNRSPWIGPGSASYGAATFIFVPLTVALIGALAVVLGSLLGK